MLHPDLSNTKSEVVKGDRWGFIDIHGNIVIPPIFYAGNGQKPYFSNGLCSIVPADTPLHYYGYIDYSGRWVIPPKFEIAGVFENDLAIVSPGPAEFSKADWLNTHVNQHFRVQMFELFLSTHKIVGMSEQELISYLGNSDFTDKPYEYGYLLQASCMGGLVVNLEARNGQITRYRYSSMPKGEWYDANHPDKGDSLFNRLI